VIAATVRHPWLTLAAAALVAAAGLWSSTRVPVDAIPDLSDNQVVVWAQWPGRSAEDVDRQVTARLALGLQGLAGVRTVRGLSLYGAGYAYVVFDDGRDFYDCRTRTLERLAGLQAELPAGVTAVLGPDATAMGQVYAFVLRGGGDLEARRRALDQVVVPALTAVAGVAEVAAVGGVVREYHVDLDPGRLEEMGVTLAQVEASIRAAGRDVGAMSVEGSGVETMIRGVAAVRTLDEIEDLVVSGDPDRATGVRLGQVARVALGGAVRQGILADEHGEQAGAIVAMRVGEDPRTVIAAVKRRLDELSATLARDGLVAEAFYDRSRLILETSATLTRTLVEELIVTMAVVLLFLMHARASLAIGLMLPLGVLVTFSAMHAAGMSANLMSLAGIAIAVGVMVDMGIVICENVFQHLVAAQERERAAGRAPMTSWRDERVVAAVIAGAREVAPAIVTASLTTIVGFLPVFALDGQAGRLFAPLAATKTMAIAGAAFFGIALVPALCRLLLPPWTLPPPLRVVLAALPAGAAFGWFAHGFAIARDHDRWAVAVPGWLAAPAMAAVVGWLMWRLGGERLRPIEDNPTSRVVHRTYARVLGWVLAHKWAFVLRCLVVAACGYLFGLGWPALSTPLHAVAGWFGADLARTAPDRWLARTFPGTGESFLPPLDEGSLLFMPSILAQGGLGESLRVMSLQNGRIAGVPEVAGVMGKMGRAETALDPAPIGMVETVVVLKPYAEWPVHAMPRGAGAGFEHRPRTLDEVRAVLSAEAEIPGVAPSWLQPIETRVIMLSTGIRSLIALQIQGDDSAAIERFAVAAEPIVRGVPGAVDVQAAREGGKPYAEIRFDRERLARFGITAEDALMAVESALGGMPLAWTIEGNQRYGIRLRYLRELRDDPEELGAVRVPLMDGGHGSIPLSSLLARPRRFTLAFDRAAGAPSPQDWRRTLPLDLARNLVPLSGDRAELTLPAGERPPVPDDARITVVDERDHPSALTWTIGPMQIRSEDGRRVGYVLLNARGRGEVDVAAEADRRLRAAIADGRLTPPPGSTWRWVGRAEQKRAADRVLALVIAGSLAAMIALIYIGTRNAVTTAIIVLGNLPVTVAGGLIAVWLAGAQMTTAVTVGFIALIGVMFNDGILIGLYLDERFRDAPRDVAGVRERVIAAGLRRIRPALMTNVATLMSLTPVLWSYGRGAEILLPMALPVIGGMAIDLLSPFMVPCLYAWWWERKVGRG